LSPTGTLLQLPVGFTYKRVMSVARDGAALSLDLPWGSYGNPRISPNGRRLMVEAADSVIEALDLTRGTRARLTSAAIGTSFVTWSADGSRVVFRRFSSPFWVAAEGSGDSGPVAGATVNDFPSAPGPDPDSMFINRIRPETSADVFLLSMSGAFEPKVLIASPAYEGGAQLSSDRKWLLYQSNASGQAEISVRRYPALDRQWQISEGGGVQARWSRDSREIFSAAAGASSPCPWTARVLNRFRKTRAALPRRVRLRPGPQHCELRRHAGWPLHHASARPARRQAARRHQLDGRAEADSRVGRCAMSADLQPRERTLRR
jgi:hypothetical protein